jgi:hypothetical protein
MMPQERAKETGYLIPLEDVARGGREAFFRSLNMEVPESEESPQWEEAADIVCQVCDMEIETTWHNLTQKAYALFKSHAANWEEEPEIVKLAWEAAVRHMANLRRAEDADDVTSAGEFDWTSWLIKRLEK